MQAQVLRLWYTAYQCLWMGTRGMQQSTASSRFAIKIGANGSINLFEDGQIQKGDLPIVKAKGEVEIKIINIQ